MFQGNPLKIVDSMKSAKMKALKDLISKMAGMERKEGSEEEEQDTGPRSQLPSSLDEAFDRAKDRVGNLGPAVQSAYKTVERVGGEFKDDLKKKAGDMYESLKKGELPRSEGERKPRPDDWMFQARETMDSLKDKMKKLPIGIDEQLRQRNPGAFGSEGAYEDNEPMDEDDLEEKKAFMSRPISSPVRGKTKSVMMDIMVEPKKKKK